MSDTLNTIDTLLQATSPRLLPAANAAVILDCSTPVFHINTSAVADPTSISFVARLIAIEGTVTFSSSGCTLSSISGNTAVLLASDMAGATASVTASITYRGTAFSTTLALSKVVDGASGGAGSRGAGAWYASGSSWVDATADAATPGANVTDDVVTIFNGSTFAETRKWSGSAWVTLSAAIPGSLITSASLTDAQLTAIAAAKITGTLTDAQLAAIAAAKITGQITTTQITNNAITTGKIAANAVTASEIAADTITASQIAASAITSSELAAGAVIAGKITAGTIVAADIAANTITAAKIVAGTITATEIAANTITAAKIAASTITATEIAASTITAAKMNITDLSAISANLGTVDIASGGYVKSGQTAFDTGTGFWLGSVSSVPKFSIGVAGGASMKWDGTTLTIKDATTVRSTPFAVNNITDGTYSFAHSATERNLGTYTASSTGATGAVSYLWTLDQSDANTAGMTARFGSSPTGTSMTIYGTCNGITNPDIYITVTAVDSTGSSATPETFLINVDFT